MSINPNKLNETAVLTFNDDFNAFSYWTGSSGTWDTGYPWRAANGGTNETNHEQQWYVEANYAPTANAGTYTVSSGVLNIKAQPTPASLKQHVNGYDYTSGMITNFHSFSQTYGYFEMRAKLPAGQGLWPAFWLLPVDGSWPPEIDIMETIGSEPDVLNTTVHYGDEKSIGSEFKASGLTTGFHTYGLDWSADTLTWYLDGRQVFQTATPAGMDKAMYLLANLAVGGEWAGSPNGSTSFPATLSIDYIRAYRDRGDVSTVVDLPDPVPEHAVVPPVSSAAVIPAFKMSVAAKRSIKGTYDWDVLTGTSKAERLDGGGGADTMSGRRGDDTYIVDNRQDKVIEKSGQGIDTVRTNLASYTLAGQVENLILTGRGDQVATGNGLSNVIKSNGKGDNTLKGGGGGDQLIAGLQADVLIGGSGKDTFVFNAAPKRAGYVKDFTVGVDVLDLRGLLKGNGGVDPVTDGKLLFAGDKSGNTVVKYRPTDHSPFVTVTTLDKVTPGSLQAHKDYFFI
jgi:beta-glucanase (GH16 family)